MPANKELLLEALSDLHECKRILDESLENPGPIERIIYKRIVKYYTSLYILINRSIES